MNKLYLILHKVRGEPAFDVAEKIMIGNEEAWVIPTSGHRAHPKVWIKLDDIPDAVIAYQPVDDLPDHYQTTKAPPPPKLNVRQLLAGLRPTLNFKRRI
jgi:hypothetical protein